MSYTPSNYGKVARSPPRPLGEASSHPDIYRTPDTDLNVKKRKITENSSEKIHVMAFENMYSNIEQMFRDIKISQEEQFLKLEQNINVLKDQNSELILSNEDIKKTMLEIVKEQNEMKTRIESLETKDETTKAIVSNMNNQHDIMERKIRETTVEIRNLPLQDNNQLMEVVQNIHKVLNLNLNISDVRNSFRLSTKDNQIRPIILEFTTTQKKLDLLNAIKDYNLKNEEKFSTTTLNMPGPKKMIYVNEHLTKKAKQIHYKCRELVKAGTWKFCWTNRGRVFLRKDEGQPVIEIKTLEQLNTLNIKSSNII